jgi:hypothetical protein
MDRRFESLFPGSKANENNKKISLDMQNENGKLLYICAPTNFFFFSSVFFWNNITRKQAGDILPKVF